MKVFYDSIYIIINLLSWQIFPTTVVGQSFHRSPPPNFPIPCILLHYSSLSHVFLYHVNPLFLWPASLSPSYFKLKHFISTSSSLLTICPNHLNHICLKCSSRSSTPTLDAITVLSTTSFNVTLHIILSILLSVAHSL